MPVPYEELTITNDFIFCKVFQNLDIAKEFLQRVLPEEKIIDVQHPLAQKVIHETVDCKSVRLDVTVETADGQAVYDVEMQATDFKPERLVFYQAMLVQDFLEKGQSYDKLPKTFVIFICPFDKYKLGRHRYTFRNLCIEEPSLEMGGGATVIVLNSKGIIDDAPELTPFFEYMNTGFVGDDSFVKRVNEAVKFARHRREWRMEFMKWEIDKRELVQEAKAEGRAEVNDATIRRSKALGLSLEDIAKILDLPLDYVRDIV